jgi:hypothetical protein
MSEENQEERFQRLKAEVKKAAEDCWNSKMELHEKGKKYADLCIQLLVAMRHIPKLVNDRILKREIETKGLDVLHPDFWNGDMIIALSEYFEREDNACS